MKYTRKKTTRTSRKTYKKPKYKKNYKKYTGRKKYYKKSKYVKKPSFRKAKTKRAETFSVRFVKDKPFENQATEKTVFYPISLHHCTEALYGRYNGKQVSIYKR